MLELLVALAITLALCGGLLVFVRLAAAAIRTQPWDAARKLWPGEHSVLGRKFFDGNRGPFEVVGVVKDVRAVSLRRVAGPIVYSPYWFRGIENAQFFA